VPASFRKDIQYYKFCLYGFFKNLRFFEAFIILFFLEKGLTYFAIGTLYAVREITVNLFEVPSGVIADSLGRRRIMILAFIFYILSFLVFFIAEAYWGFFTAMLLFSLGEAFRSGNNKAMIFHYLDRNDWKDQKVHYYGHTRSCSQMGSALSALAGAAIVFISGSYQYIFLLSVVPYLLDLVLVASYPRFLDGEMQKFNWKLMRKNFRKVFDSLLLALKSRNVLQLFGSLSVYSGYYKAVKDYVQPVIATWAVALAFVPGLSNEQRSALMIGLVFFMIYLLSSVASRKSGMFSDKFSSLATPLNATIILGFSFGLLSGLAYNMEFLVISVICFIVIYMVENIRKPVGVAYLGNAVSDQVTASVLSVDSQLKSLVAAALAPLIGIFADLYGIGWSIIAVSAGLILLSPFILLRSKKING
jgi:MFS family permease